MTGSNTGAAYSADDRFTLRICSRCGLDLDLESAGNLHPSPTALRLEMDRHLPNAKLLANERCDVRPEAASLAGEDLL